MSAPGDAHAVEIADLDALIVERRRIAEYRTRQR